MLELLLQIKAAVEAAQEQDRECLSEAEEAVFEGCYKRLLEQGFQANATPESAEPVARKRGLKKQTPVKNLLDRLQAH